MKKTLVLVLSLMLLLVAFAGTFSVSAAQYTKDDIVAKISESVIYKYIKGDIANLVRTVDATPEQLNQLYGVAERFAALKLTDNGGSASEYTRAETDAVLELIDEACSILGYTYTFEASAKPQHKNDLVFKVFDANGKAVYIFDGDIVKQTGFDSTATIVTISLLGCALVAAAAFIAKKARA